VKLLRWGYPSLAGVLLGLLQTGLFFQLAFTLSSSFRTFLMVTVAWLVGSALGTHLASRVKWSLNDFLGVALLAYFACATLPGIAPFNTDIWFIYAALIVVIGLYPGVFFVRVGQSYLARTLFFRENNGFILGLVSGTLLFLVLGRAALWVAPLLVAGIVMGCTSLFVRRDIQPVSPQPNLAQPVEGG
jgi:hypothetical protein